LRKISPGIVHFHVPWVPCAWEGILAARSARVPLIVRTEHNPIPAPLSLRQRLKLRVLDTSVDHVVFVSKGSADTHLKHGRGWLRRWSVVPNGIPMQAPEP